MVTRDQLAPRHHLRFDLIREKTEGLHRSNNGRPAIDPVVLFEVLLMATLFGAGSERQLVREIEVNAAYRWFPAAAPDGQGARCPP